MNIKNIVKVMNFHALLRVDKARKEAERYFAMEEELRGMIDNITNNRNFVLDKKTLRAQEDAPVLNIYVGSDYGFCGGYNYVVNEKARKDLSSEKIILGKKIWHGMDNVKMHVSKESFQLDPKEVESYIEESIKLQRYSEINILYNNYVDTGNISWCSKRIFPFEFSSENAQNYTEDFVCETDLNELLISMVTTYINFEIRITVINSLASENVMRQNSTSESLKKIEEMEEEALLAERKEKSQKEFQKVIESFSKIKKS